MGSLAGLILYTLLLGLLELQFHFTVGQIVEHVFVCLRDRPGGGRMPHLTNGPRFVPLPDHMFRRCPLVDLELLALAGAIVALAFAGLLLGLLEARLGFSLGDVVRGALVG